MGKRKSSLRDVGLEPYRGRLTPVQAAAGIQAARLNAMDLLETSRLLYEKGRYGHSLVFSILSVEETAKVTILKNVFLGITSEDEGWRAYRQHTKKASQLNFAIKCRISATFPEMAPEKVREIGNRGPSAEEMDALKQLCLYSDCLCSADAAPVFHLPRNVDQKTAATSALADAEALVPYLRDYPPEELVVWLKHVREGRKKGQTFVQIIKPLYEELLEKGMITERQWAPILRFFETGDPSVFETNVKNE